MARTHKVTLIPGSRVAFRHEGRALEPIKGQFVMDFQDTGNVVLEERPIRAIAAPQTAAEYFNRGVALLLSRRSG